MTVTRVNLSGISDDDLDNTGTLPPGMYHVRLEGTEETDPGRTHAIILWFRIIHGPFKSRIFASYLYDTARNQKQVGIFAKRMGLIGSDAGGKSHEVDFDDAVGNQFVIEVINEEYQGQKRHKVSYAGIWPEDDPRVADVPRARAEDDSKVPPTTSTGSEYQAIEDGNF